MHRLAIVFVLAAGITSVGAAEKKQVYKWTDANGVVHFTDAPPPKDTPNVQSVRLVGGMTSSAPAVAEESAAPTTAPNSAPNQSAAPATAAAKPDDATLCKTARANLELLQGDTPVGVADAQGKADVLDDKARATQLANAKVAIARYCK
jgi:hypothetical protein